MVYLMRGEESMRNQSKNNKNSLNINEINENIKKIYRIDKSLVPQYLDNISDKQKRKKKIASPNNEFLKYM